MFFNYVEVPMYPIKSVNRESQMYSEKPVEKGECELEENPPDCSWFMYHFGEEVCIVDGDARSIERWVKLVAKQAHSRLNWHYSGGRASILHFGSRASRARTIQTMNDLEIHLNGHIMELEYPSTNRIENGIATIRLFGLKIRLW